VTSPIQIIFSELISEPVSLDIFHRDHISSDATWADKTCAGGLGKHPWLWIPYVIELFWPIGHPHFFSYDTVTSTEAWARHVRFAVGTTNGEWKYCEFEAICCTIMATALYDDQSYKIWALLIQLWFLPYPYHMTTIQMIQAVWWAGKQSKCVNLCSNVLILFNTNPAKWLLVDIIKFELTCTYVIKYNHII